MAHVANAFTDQGGFTGALAGAVIPLSRPRGTTASCNGALEQLVWPSPWGL